MSTRTAAPGPPEPRPPGPREAGAPGRGAPDPFAALLRLLARDAPAEELHRVLATAEEAHHPRLGELREAVLSALEVRALLSERRRREQELAALYETAQDLSSLRDVEAVLHAIVQRARQLLRTDAAYLMHHEQERRATRMRVTAGIRTERFKHTALDLGAGLGGLVAATCTPYATADYAADARFVHTIDDVVAAEGLVAILGVPLRLGEEVIGVLFAADRRERPFSREEVALLVSLADHAAVAIENASRFQEARAALEDLRRAHDVIRAHSEVLERAALVHERLAQVLVSGGRLPEVAAAVAEVLAVSLVVADPAGRPLACAGADAAGLLAGGAGTGEEGVVRPELLPRDDPAGSAAAGRATARLRGPDGRAVTRTPVLAGAEVLGSLLAVGRVLDEAEVRTLERAAVVTALVLVHARAVAEAEQRVRGEFVDDLLSLPHRDPDALRRRAAHLGLDLDRPHALAVARAAATERCVELAQVAAAAAAGQGLAGQHRG
ncbi:GAF domain-containing protein, partial [Kineococcus glutinatus]|uniref:GAF domain-containing protein n=1 Tax=Kineococcus glutinatus TaxID=1070872 RepID=UPI0031ECD93F